MKTVISLFFCISLLFFPLTAKTDMSGGNFRIYADTFSSIDDTGSSRGGTFELFGTAGEVGAGNFGLSITGVITVKEPAFSFDDDDTFTISDGYVTTTFLLANRAGGNSGQIEFGQILIDTGGGLADTPEDLANHFVTAINATTHDLQVTASHNTNDGVVLLRNNHGESVGIVPITEDITDPDAVTFSGMSISARNFTLRGGFQAMELSSLSLSLSENTINFGELAIDEVTSSSLIATVSADSGYTLTATEDGNLRSGALDIDDVVDGNIAAGTEAYGIQTSGDDGQQNAAPVALTANSLTLANNASSVSGKETTVNFLISVSNNTLAGNYAHTVTFSIISAL